MGELLFLYLVLFVFYVLKLVKDRYDFYALISVIESCLVECELLNENILF